MQYISVTIALYVTLCDKKLSINKNPFTLVALKLTPIKMKKITFLVFLIASAISAQQLDIKKLKGMNPRAIGPAGMSGRITAIDVVNNQPDIIYVGAASGGVLEIGKWRYRLEAYF